MEVDGDEYSVCCWTSDDFCFFLFATDVVHEIDTLCARNHPSIVHQLVFPPGGRHPRSPFSSNIVFAFLSHFVSDPAAARERIIRVLLPSLVTAHYIDYNRLAASMTCESAM